MDDNKEKERKSGSCRKPTPIEYSKIYNYSSESNENKKEEKEDPDVKKKYWPRRLIG